MKILLFQGCTSLESVIIPNSVTSIKSYAFRGCAVLANVNIPNSVNSIDSSAFYNCTRLNSITVNWTTPLPINEFVFYSLNLPTITLYVPFGAEALYDATSVWTDFGTISGVVAPVVLGEKFEVARINYQVTKATMPYEVAVGENGVTNNRNFGRISNSIQAGVSGTLTIPDTVSIGGNSFSVTSIMTNAFRNSTGLIMVNVPNSITSIGDFVFLNCSGLTALTVNWTIPLVVNSNVFENITLASVTLNVPVGTETSYKATNVWKDFKVATTLGANNLYLKNNLKFYPNPVQNKITFLQEINNLEMFDIGGKKVKFFKNSNTTFDVSSLQKGVYILKGQTTEGKDFNDKMIKE